MENLYKLLGVPPAATNDEIHKAYKALALQYHPDRSPLNVGKFTEITAAWAVLKHKETRAEYDAKLKMLLKPCQRCDGKGVTERQLTFTRKELKKCRSCGGLGML